MPETNYLSYTHGLSLQSLCREFGSDAAAAGPGEALRWIEAERRNLLKKQSPLWDVPVSTRNYYDYLERLSALLRSGAAAEAFDALAREIRELTREQIHVLFLIQEPFCWASLESVFEAARYDPDVETALVYTPFYNANFKEQTDYFDTYAGMGLPVLRHDEYDLAADSPDVVFMLKPYTNVPGPYEFRQLECVIPRSVYIAYGMEITADLAKYGFQYYPQYKAWRHCVYGQIVKDYSRVYGYRDGENVAVWGHPKADFFRDPTSGKEQIPEEWKRFIRGRKTILWTPHHLVELEGNGTGTWLIWGEQILKSAMNHPELAFIIRPHPLLEGTLINSGAMTKKQFDRMRRKIDEADNILWDESADYHDAFNASDGIITDGTTFCIEYLYTKKPILLTPRNMEGFFLYEKMLSGYYIGRSMQDIENYLEMIRDGEDPLRDKRLALYDSTFFIPEEGTVGENIIKNVKTDLTEECGKAVLPETGETPAAPEAKQIPADGKAPVFPLFSLLVVCYKNTELLYGMLDTIFEQDYPRIELIVSDDCSDDFDVEQVRSYIESRGGPNVERVLVRKNEKNMRTVRHIHDALELTTGEYVVFTAADDRFVGRDVLSRYVESFLQKPDAEWLVARCSFTSPDYKTFIYTSPTKADEPFFERGDARLLYSRWARRGMAIPCCMAFKKSAFELVGGIDLDFRFLEDWPLELKLLRGGHAPVYLPVVTALHSTGGVSNSNDRYGKEIRRQFYDDKYLLFKKEVEPYKQLMTPEDRKCYEQYQREIMARHYFIFVDWPGTTRAEKIRLLLKKPIAIWWMFELWYVNRVKHIKRKKTVLVSLPLLLIGALPYFLGGDAPRQTLFRVIAAIAAIAGLLLLLIALISYPLEKYFKAKEELRKKLVN